MSAEAVVAGRYQLLQTLGRGAFGQTHRATDLETGRPVAIKVLDLREAADWKAYELFEREAAVLRALRHQAVPEVHDFLKAPWEGAEAAFLVMEYVEGSSMAALITDGRHHAPAEVTHLLLELLGVLEYLHGRIPPILHRDIKPANIIVRPNGFPVLVDFGSVRRVFHGPDEAGSTVTGTYGYMPYEQFMGHATPASDLYALAATFLHLLTGRAPRDFMNGEGRIEVPAGLPGDPRLRPILERLLRPSPAERFASAAEVREALLQPVGGATAPTGSETTAALVRRDGGAMVTLPPAPRPLEGATKEQFERLAHSAWRLMDGSSKPGDDYSVMDIAATVFFSVITAGILPLTFISLASQRRRRLRRFFRDGLLTTGRVLRIEPEDVGFSVTMSRVHYEFEADGQVLRDADQVLPAVAHRWSSGDRLQLLYLPEDDYDSVIVSSS
jgi:serine/threonine protein kinase